MQSELKILVKELKPFKKEVAIVAVTGVIYATAYSRLALMIKTLFDDLSAGKHEEITRLVPIAIGLAFLSAAAKYIHLSKMNYTAECVVQNIRHKLQEKFMRLNLTYHNNYPAGSGGMMSRVINDIRSIQDGLRVVADIFLHPLLFIFLLGNLFMLDWKLTLATFAMVPVIGLILKSITRSMIKYIPFERVAQEHMTSTLKESLDGIRVIQSFNLENELGTKLRAQADDYLAVRKTIYSRQEAAGPATEFLATIMVMLVLLYTSHQISLGLATPGTFIGFITSLLMLNQPIKRVQETIVRMQDVVISVRRINDVLVSEEEVPQAAKPIPFPQDWKKITYKDVSFKYKDDLVLDSVNLEITRGEVVAFVGSSGSGKSTLVNLLERFFDPTSGEILIDGVNINQIDLKDLRKNIALVNQDVFLFSDSIERNIQAGDFQRAMTDVPAVAQVANAHAFIAKTPQGYQSPVGDRGNMLSGGEKQRVSIARALFKDAPILILDEATSALDSASEKEVQKGLDQLLAGRTAFVIAHRLSTIQNAHRIYVLSRGKLVESGTHEQLLSHNGAYCELQKMQTLSR